MTTFRSGRLALPAVGLAATLLSATPAWCWAEVYWGKYYGGVFGGTCAELAPYAPAGWLCRDHVNGGGIVVRDDGHGTYSLVNGPTTVPLASDRMQQFFTSLRTRKPDKTVAAQEFEAAAKADDGKVSAARLSQVRRDLGVR